MTSALTWLNDLVQWFGRWVPRLVLIHPTHRGVLFGPRGSARAGGPGLVLYWPITHALVQVPVTTQSIQLCSQFLPAQSTDIVPCVLLCAAAIQFRVEDPIAAATRALHLHAVVDNRAEAAIARHASTADKRDIWAKAAAADLSVDLRRWGIVLEQLDFVHMGIGVVLKNSSEWSYSDHANGARPT